MAETVSLPVEFNLATANAPAPSNGLATYARAVNALPLLSAEQEHALALRFRQHGDLDAARQLVLANLRHVVRVARGFNGYGLPQADLIQEGNIGLMKAVKHFDPARNVRLLSFAVHWIRAEIYDFVLRNWRIVKVATTKAQRKLFFNLRKTRERIGWMTQGETAQLAERLDVPVETVREMEARLTYQDIPFDAHEDDDEDGHVSPAGYLQDMRYNPEVVYGEAAKETSRATQLREALAALDERSRDIIQRRWLNAKKATLHDLARKYRISAERVRQIEQKALTHMKHLLAPAAG
jgi:RNA polymerase sigma-32 factor